MRDTRVIAIGLSADRTRWAAGVLVVAAMLLLFAGCGGGDGGEDGSAVYGIAEYAEHSCSREAVRDWLVIPEGSTWGEVLERAEALLEHQESYDGPLSAEFRAEFHEPWVEGLRERADRLRTQDAAEIYDEGRLEELTAGIREMGADDASEYFGEQFGEACQKSIASWGGGPG